VQRKALLVALFWTFAICVSAQLTVDNSVDATTAIEDILLGEGVTAFGITSTGDGNQIGSFNGINSNLGLDGGVILATGDVGVAPGPNNSGSSSLGGGNSGASDPDIVLLNPSNSFNDCVVLEFDFVATGDSVKFNYVFASEEYPEFANSSYNDTFGFFLSGAGISGPYSNNAVNIAQIPGTSTAVSINNLNNGTTGTGGPCEYCEFYIHNGTGGSAPQNTDNTVIQYDGFTTVMTAESQVQCGETYHIKIAIADAGDTGYDSAVFLEAGSFTSNQIEVDLQIVDISANDSTLFEGCGSANILFTRPPGSSLEQTFLIQVTGTGTNGLDFTFLPDSMTFPAGVDQIIFPFETFEDGITEGMETVQISFTNFLLCGALDDSQTYSFYIAEATPLVLSYDEPTIDCGETVILNVTVEGGYGYYDAEWGDGTEGFSLEVSPGGTDTFLITVSDTCSVIPVAEEVMVTIPDYPELELNIGSDLELNCLDNLQISSVAAGGFGAYEYSWTVNGVQVSTDVNLDYLTDDEGTAVLTITDACGETTSETVNYEFPPVVVNVDLGSDIAATCIEFTDLSALVSGGIGAYSYSWQVDGLEVSTATTYSLQTDVQETIELIVTDQCENEGEDEVVISIPQLSVFVDLGQDLEVNCLDLTNLTGDISGGVGGFTYTWYVDGDQVAETPNYQIQVDGTTEVVLVSTDACGNQSEDILVLTTPPVPISVDLGGDLVVICIDTTYLSPIVSGGVGDYTYYWEMEGIAMGENDWVNVQTESDAQITVIVEDACGNIAGDEIQFTVPPLPISITFDPDSILCAGESRNVIAFAEGGQGNLTYYWAPVDSYGHAIIVEPMQNTTYTVFVNDQCGNTAQASTVVNVELVIADYDFDYVGDWVIEIFNNSTGAVQYAWDLDNGEWTDEENPTLSYFDNEAHDVILYSIGELGCVDSILHTFYPMMDLFIPNAFTPNNDGINDYFQAYGHEIFTFEIWIYNRWGEMVYHSNDINESWTGSHIGGDYYVPDGQYGYFAKAVGVRQDAIEKTGSITVYR
jgi:gliding motility-associated-like protein